jgi:hypothetical protein
MAEVAGSLDKVNFLEVGLAQLFDGKEAISGEGHQKLSGLFDQIRELADKSENKNLNALAKAMHLLSFRVRVIGYRDSTPECRAKIEGCVLNALNGVRGALYILKTGTAGSDKKQEAEIKMAAEDSGFEEVESFFFENVTETQAQDLVGIKNYLAIKSEQFPEGFTIVARRILERFGRKRPGEKHPTKSFIHHVVKLDGKWSEVKTPDRACGWETFSNFQKLQPTLYSHPHFERTFFKPMKTLPREQLLARMNQIQAGYLEHAKKELEGYPAYINEKNTAELEPEKYCIKPDLSDAKCFIISYKTKENELFNIFIKWTDDGFQQYNRETGALIGTPDMTLYKIAPEVFRRFLPID